MKDKLNTQDDKGGYEKDLDINNPHFANNLFMRNADIWNVEHEWCMSKSRFIKVISEWQAQQPIKDVYWEERCKLAETCLEESPCDPDITKLQIEAWKKYHEFIKTNPLPNTQ